MKLPELKKKLQNRYAVRVVAGVLSIVLLGGSLGTYTVYADKSFDFIVKTPPVAVQLLEAAKQKSGSSEPNRKKVASITEEQCKQIAADKMVDLNCFTIESAMRLVAGTARSMGITVKGDFPA